MNQGSRTIPKQGIAAPTGPTAGIPRNHPHGALHPARPAGRNQCSAALRTLHHHKCLGKGHQPTVPRREMPWSHTAAGSAGAHQQPLPADLLLQLSMVGGIDTVQGCPQHRDGCTVSGQTAAMGSSINLFSKTTKDGPTRLGQDTARSSAMTRPWSEAERVPTAAMAVRALMCRSSDRSPST